MKRILLPMILAASPLTAAEKAVDPIPSGKTAPSGVVKDETPEQLLARRQAAVVEAFKKLAAEAEANSKARYELLGKPVPTRLELFLEEQAKEPKKQADGNDKFQI